MKGLPPVHDCRWARLAPTGADRVRLSPRHDGVDPDRKNGLAK